MIRRKEDINEESLKQEFEEIRKRLEINSLDEALIFPKFFQIEPSRVCNSRCRFCAVDDWDKSVPFMPDKLFDKLVTEFKNHTNHIEVVCLARAGEPLLDKKIVDKVKTLKEIGINKVTLSTNASLLSKEKALDLLNAGLDDIMLSIDTVNREKYESVRRGLDFDTVMKNIRTLFEIREKIRPEVIVRVRGVATFDINSTEGINELEKWESFWGQFRKSQDRIYMKQAHSWGNQKEGQYIPEYENVFHPCILPWSTLHVTTMGLVPLCPQDYDAKANLGDANKNFISDIWNNAKWERIRKLHSSGKRNEISFCRGCYLFDKEFSLEK